MCRTAREVGPLSKYALRTWQSLQQEPDSNLMAAYRGSDPGTSARVSPEGHGGEGQVALCIVHEIKPIGLEDLEVLPGRTFEST